MEINGHSALVTGASRGLGKCLVEELLARGARRVYAAAPEITSLEAAVAADRERVVPLAVEITDGARWPAAKTAHDVSLVFNNAGVMALGARYVSSGEHDLDELVEMVGRPDVVYEARGVVGVAMEALAGASMRRSSRSRRCSPTPTTWVCSPRRSDRSVKRSGTSRRPSRISR